MVLYTGLWLREGGLIVQRVKGRVAEVCEGILDIGACARLYSLCRWGRKKNIVSTSTGGKKQPGILPDGEEGSLVQRNSAGRKGSKKGEPEGRPDSGKKVCRQVGSTILASGLKARQKP